MASVFLGLEDPELTVPTPEQLARTSAALFDSKFLVLHTNIGDITATFDREHASETVLQVARFVVAGALDATQMLGQRNGVTVTLTGPKVGPQMQPFHSESGVPRRTGTVAYCLAGGDDRQPTIVIDTDNRIPPNNLCIGFARLGDADIGVVEILPPAPAQRWPKQKQSSHRRSRRRSSPRGRGCGTDTLSVLASFGTRFNRARRRAQQT